MPSSLTELLVTLGLGTVIAAVVLAGIQPSRAAIEQKWKTGYVSHLEQALMLSDDGQTPAR